MIENKKIMTVLLLGIIVVLLGLVIIKSYRERSLNSRLHETKIAQQGTIEFFYADSCPHCKDVENWIEKNKLEDKIVMIKKEVYNNRQNARELYKVAQHCGIPASDIKVPFLLTPEGKCLVGTPEIISYLGVSVGLPSGQVSGLSAEPQ